MPLYEVGVVDVVVRRPTVLGSLPAIPYIEYQVALTRRTDQKTAVVGKRYSDLFYFNHEVSSNSCCPVWMRPLEQHQRRCRRLNDCVVIDRMMAWQLHRREIIRKLDAPSFPEKKLFSVRATGQLEPATHACRAQSLTQFCLCVTGRMVDVADAGPYEQVRA